MNPIIKFTTLFGLLAVEMAVGLVNDGRPALTHVLAAAFFVLSVVFVYRSFYGMRIRPRAGSIDRPGPKAAKILLAPTQPDRAEGSVVGNRT